MLALLVVLAPLLARSLAEVYAEAALLCAWPERALVAWLYPPRQVIYGPGHYRPVNGQLRRMSVVRHQSARATRTAGAYRRRIEALWGGRDGEPLPPLAGGAELFVFESANGKWSTAANWKGGATPKNADDVKIPTGKIAKVESTASARSVLLEGAIEIASGHTLSIGGAEQPGTETGAAGTNVALKVTSGASLTGAGGLVLNSKYTTNEIKLEIAPSIGVTIEFAAGANAKYLLEEALTTTGGILQEEETTLKSNGHAISCESFEQAAQASITTNLENTTLTIEGTWAPKATSGTLTLTGSTIVMTGGPFAEFYGGGFTYPAVTLEAAAVTLKVTSKATFKTLTLKWHSGGHPIQFEVGKTQTVEHLEVEGTGSGKILALESTTTSAATIKLVNAKTVAFVSFKYMTIETGPLTVEYEGTESEYNIEHNEKVTETLIFKSKSEVFSGAIKGALGLIGVVAGAKQANGAAEHVVTLAQPTGGKKRGVAALLQKLGLVQLTAAGAGPSEEEPPEVTEELAGAVKHTLRLLTSIIGAKRADGPAAHTLGAGQSSTGARRATAAILEKITLAEVALGVKDATGNATQKLGLAQSKTGSKITDAASAVAVGLRQATAGARSAAAGVVETLRLAQLTQGSEGESALGAIKQALQLAVATVASKRTDAANRQPVALSQPLVASKRAGGPTAQQAVLRQVALAVEAFSGAISQQVELAVKATGSKTAVNSVTQRLALKRFLEGIKTAAGAVGQRVGLATPVSEEPPAERTAERELIPVSTVLVPPDTPMTSVIRRERGL